VATYDSADLAERVRKRLKRPADDELCTLDERYQLLSEAQEEWVYTFASIIPHALYGAPDKLETFDGGETYVFGSAADDDTRRVFPLGQVELKASRNGRILVPGQEGDPSADFVVDGDRIRFPGGKTRTFTDGPFARFITPPGVIDATHQPSLVPIEARKLLVERACQKWAETSGLADPLVYEKAELRMWLGNPPAGDYGMLGALRRQFAHAGAEAEPGGSAWWYGISTGEGY